MNNSALMGGIVLCTGLMASVLASGSGWNPGREHFVVFLGKTLYMYSHSASLQPGVYGISLQ